MCTYTVARKYVDTGVFLLTINNTQYLHVESGVAHHTKFKLFKILSIVY